MDFSDVSFDMDFSENLDFEVKAPPPIDKELQDQSIYPEETRSPLFYWDKFEEDLQLAALGWFLFWRKKNTFRIEGNTGYWTMPPDDVLVWKAQKDRMIDWAFLERGGLDLDATWDMLRRRQWIRIGLRPIQTLRPSTPPAGAGVSKKGATDVRKPQQNLAHRFFGKGSRTQNEPSRPSYVPLQFGND